MMDDRCWHCRRKSERGKSLNTGIVYCLSCGTAVEVPVKEKGIAVHRTGPLPLERRDDVPDDDAAT